MLRCLAGICCGNSAPEENVVLVRQVVKPIRPLDCKEPCVQAKTLKHLTKYGLVLAPPGADVPIAVVSSNFETNSSRLLVVVPAPGDAAIWDPTLGEHGNVAHMMLWAEANGYASAFFSHQALSASPAENWDRVVRGSPARHATVIVASGMLNCLQAALQSVHPLLFSRFRTVCIFGADTLEDFNAQTPELRRHLEGSTVAIPSTWQQLETQVAYQYLFELLRDKEERWHTLELKKYAGFQGLKENDMPGLKRMGVDQRVQRLDRDRNDDELARLLKKHEEARSKAEDSEEEPGID
eukprot:s1260_g15.t1